MLGQTLLKRIPSGVWLCSSVLGASFALHKSVLYLLNLNQNPLPPAHVAKPGS